eukprot:gene7322-9976_t
MSANDLNIFDKPVSQFKMSKSSTLLQLIFTFIGALFIKSTSTNINTISLICSKKDFLDIRRGNVCVIDNFIDDNQVEATRNYIKKLYDENQFVASGLSNKAVGNNQNFGQNDRKVYPLVIQSQNNPAVRPIIDKIKRLRKELKINLNRESLDNPDLGHELFFSLSLPGSSLKRHLDEKHEEFKGRRGWLSPSRRSITWLLYLCDSSWNSMSNGGELRAFPQVNVSPNSLCGSHDDNIQIGWLSNKNNEANHSNGFSEKNPVYLDCWKKHSSDDMDYLSGLYILDASIPNNRIYITREFSLHQFIGNLVPRFDEFLTAPFDQCTINLIEDIELWARGSEPIGSKPIEISPKGGRLVLFDSVSIPHEVLETRQGERVALAGWFHEKVQTLPDNLAFA